MLNFNLPYFATNPQEFWRRWHISLSTWLRDYLYFSLGGNRKGEARTYINLMLTMVLGGLWHGASWVFVAWGVYHGSLLCLHRFVARFIFLPPSISRRPAARFAWKGLCMAFMFILTLYGWLIFRASDWDQLSAMTLALFSTAPDTALLRDIAKILFYVWPLLLVQVLQFRSGDLLVIRTFPPLVQALFYLIWFYLILILGAFDAQSFIYFQF